MKRGLMASNRRQTMALSPAITSLPVPPSIRSLPSWRGGHVAAADEVVVARAAVDRVVALLAEDDVVAGAGVDGSRCPGCLEGRLFWVRIAVKLSVPPRSRVQRRQLQARHDGNGWIGSVDLTVGAEDQVVAPARGDVVVAGAAEDDIAARPSLIVSPPSPLDWMAHEVGELERVGREGSIGVVADERGEPPAVAEDDALAFPRVDRVGPGAAEDDVVARPGGDRVVTADVDVQRGDRVDVAGPGRPTRNR